MFNKRTGLKKKVIDTGMSQNDFAHDININRTTLSDIIRGRINPTQAELIKLAAAFDCAIEDVENDFS